MDLQGPTSKIKEDVEKSDETHAEDIANMKLEQTDPNDDFDCDRIKFEQGKMNNWVDCGSSTSKTEYMDEDVSIGTSQTAPLKDEMGIKLETNLGDYANYDLLDRIKEECNVEHWEEQIPSANMVEQVKIEKQAADRVKLEEEEEGTRMNKTKVEDLDTTELTEQLDIKPDGTSNVEVDSASNQKFRNKGVGVVHREAETELFICYNCNYSATRKQNIINHIMSGNCNSRTREKSYTSNGYICTKCNKIFRRKMNLDDHVVKKHAELIGSVSRKIHECSVCEYKTTIKSFLAEHMLMHEGSESSCKILECTHCDAKFKRKLAHDEHVLRKHPDHIATISSKVYVCPNCPYVTTRKDVLDKHMFQHPEMAVNCNYTNCRQCGEAFKSRLAVDDHILKNHPDSIKSVTSKIHECSKCSYKTTIKSNIDGHMMTIHPDTASDLFITCVHCKATFKNRRTLDDHIIRKHPNFIATIKRNVHQCPNCKYRTVRKADLDKHLSVHPEVVSKYKLSTCIHCNVGFKSRQVLDDHIIREHPSYVASISSKIHKCSECTYITTMKNNLDRHTMAMHPSAASSLFSRCMHCNSAFKNRITLDDHIVRKHPDVISSVTREIYKCPNCTYKTVKKSDLKRHLLVHPGALSN